MGYDYKINIEYEKDGEVHKHEMDFAFSNGVKERVKYTDLPPEMSLEAADELTHLLQHCNEFHKRIDCDNFVKFELNKKL